MKAHKIFGSVTSSLLMVSFLGITLVLNHKTALACDPQNPYECYQQRTTIARSVTYMSDIQPTDKWFRAVQSLVERYDIDVAFPDNTFKGNLKLTRTAYDQMLSQSRFQMNELRSAVNKPPLTQNEFNSYIKNIFNKLGATAPSQMTRGEFVMYLDLALNRFVEEKVMPYDNY